MREKDWKKLLGDNRTTDEIIKDEKLARKFGDLDTGFRCYRTSRYMEDKTTESPNDLINIYREKGYL